MQRKTKIILISVILLILAALVYYGETKIIPTSSHLLADNENGTVEKVIYGNVSANKTIALITGIHPREKLAMDPEIEAAKQWVSENDDVKVINYKVNVTKDPDDYKKGRAQGESLVHNFVNPDVTSSDADCVIISHSHIESYGEGFYLATPEMDNRSVEIGETIGNTSDFNYYPTTGNETYKSTSAVLVSKPIARAGYPTFVYEIPEDITEWDSTSKTKELFNLLMNYI